MATSQMKLTGKIGWVSLNSIYKRIFEFDSNAFRSFKDCFFKVKETSVVFYGLPLMYEESGEPHFPFYWQSNPTKFKSFEEHLMSLEERVNKAILEQLSILLDVRAILSLPSKGNPLCVLDNKVACLFCARHLL